MTVKFVTLVKLIAWTKTGNSSETEERKKDTKMIPPPFFSLSPGKLNLNMLRTVSPRHNKY